MNSDNVNLVKTQVKKTTPEALVKLIATQMDRSDEAKKRIEEEGIVVRDMKGSVIQHPALKIEQDACKIIAAMIDKYKY